MTKHRDLPDVDLDVDDVRDSRGRRITEAYAQAATAQAVASVGSRQAVSDGCKGDVAAGDLPSHPGALGKSGCRG